MKKILTAIAAACLLGSAMLTAPAAQASAPRPHWVTRATACPPGYWTCLSPIERPACPPGWYCLSPIERPHHPRPYRP